MDGCGVSEGGGASHALLPLTNSGAVPTVFVVKVICRRDSHQTMTGLYGKQQETGVSPVSTRSLPCTMLCDYVIQ